MNLVYIAMGWWSLGADTALRSRRDERGLSQSTENAILLAGAVAIAVLIVQVIRAYVESRLPS